MNDGEARSTAQQAPRVPNSVFRGIRRDERGESQREFADAMARVAWEMGVEVYPDEGYVQRLESGIIRWPHRTYRTILEKLCGRPARHLGFAPTVRSGSSEVPSHGNMALREAIWASGIEIAEFAREIEVDPKTVERWITRGVIPRPMHRWKSALILGIDESELWSDAVVAREIQEHKRKQTSKRKSAKPAPPLETDSQAIDGPIVDSILPESASKENSAELNHSRASSNSDTIDDDGTAEIATLMAWISGTNTTSDMIEQVERATLYLSEVHSTVSPKVVLSGVLQTHGQVKTYLQSGKQRLRQTRELLRVDSGLLSHACLLLGDLGHHQKASKYGVAALVLAQEADVDESSAWSARAKTARWQERYVESAELARRGFEAVALSPTKVELAYREANAIALFGDKGRARRALHSAQAAAEALPRDPSSSVWSFPAARQAIFAQSVAIHTGDPDGALYAAEMAEAAWVNGEPKLPATCAQIQTGASIAHLMKDSLDGAAYNIAPVLNLPCELRISTVIGYVRRLRNMLVQSRFAESVSAIELAEKIDDFISAAPLGKD